MEYLYTLCSGIIIFGLIASYTDIRYRMIKNIHLLFALTYALLIHASFALIGAIHISWKLLAVNFLLAFALSFLLFVKHYWSAGDSKFFIVLCMLMPHSQSVPMFLFATLFLFININLVSFASILPWSIRKLFGAAKSITPAKINNTIKKLGISLLVVFSISWIIWLAFGKLPWLGPLPKTLILFLFYWILSTFFEKIKNRIWLYVFVIISGFALRILLQPWMFSSIETIKAYLLSTFKFTFIFSFAGALISNPLHAVNNPAEEKVVNAPAMLIGALMAQTPLVFWIMDALMFFKQK